MTCTPTIQSTTTTIKIQRKINFIIMFFINLTINLKDAATACQGTR